MKKKAISELGELIQPHHLVPIKKSSNIQGITKQWVRVAEFDNHHSGSVLLNIQTNYNEHAPNIVLAHVIVSMYDASINLINKMTVPRVITELRVYKNTITDKWAVDVFVDLITHVIHVTASMQYAMTLPDACASQVINPEYIRKIDL